MADKKNGRKKKKMKCNTENDSMEICHGKKKKKLMHREDKFKYQL